jgi:hypothetical protein
MWNVTQKIDAGVMESLSAKGFRVSSAGGVMRVEKYGCGAEFRRTADGRYQMTILPTLLIDGQFSRLWDAGYQKFFITANERKVPALAEQLLNMRRLNEELRSAVGVFAYYNEALGSTCLDTVYDRVQGRPGDIPDKSVGVKNPSDANEKIGRH